MIKKIIILGTGGSSIDILDTINEINKIDYQYNCIGFLDDNIDNLGKEFYGKKVLGSIKSAYNFVNDCFFVSGIGSEKNFYRKEKILSELQIPLDCFETIVHPRASVSELSSVGKGTVILQNVTIASNVQIGDHVIVLPNSVINHNNIIGDYTCITSGVNVSGGVNIGKSCYLGTNCSIIGDINIGDYCLIGMGSNVLINVQENSVMVGNPATKLRDTLV